jgi:hypothetical protein
MFYPYQCAKEKPCSLKGLDLEKIHPTLRPEEEICIEKHPDGVLVWLECHGMSDTPEIKCPACGGKAMRSTTGLTPPLGHIRGQCYLNRADQRKQMDLRTLEAGQDPYGHMRQSGEVDHLKKQLQGKVKQKQYFGPSCNPKPRAKFKKK